MSRRPGKLRGPFQVIGVLGVVWSPGLADPDPAAVISSAAARRLAPMRPRSRTTSRPRSCAGSSSWPWWWSRAQLSAGISTGPGCPNAPRAVRTTAARHGQLTSLRRLFIATDVGCIAAGWPQGACLPRLGRSLGAVAHSSRAAC